MISNSVRMASHSLIFDLDRTLIEMDQMSMPSDDSEPLADMLLVLLARNKLLECTYMTSTTYFYIDDIAKWQNFVGGPFPIRESYWMLEKKKN